MAILWLVPGIGAFGYLVLGVNRIQRKAEQARQHKLGLSLAEQRRYGAVAVRVPDDHRSDAPDLPSGPAIAPAGLPHFDATAAPRFVAHARLARAVTGMALMGGNEAEMLVNGDEAYPAMLDAMAKARHRIALSTYIFEWDCVGRAFADALKAAQDRGVAVYVIIDAMGSFRVDRHLRAMGIRVLAFNKPSPLHLAFLNLRTHRKLLLVDEDLVFTGGMNIRDVHQSGGKTGLLSQDVMFCIQGPIAAQFAHVFAEDWRFAGGESLTEGESLAGDLWKAPTFDQKMKEGDDVEPRHAVMRLAPDGPDGNFSRAGWIFESALSVARRSVRIATPYFLPDINILSALSQAALRGVVVDIILPRVSNYRVLGWASEALFAPLLSCGVRLYQTPPPLDHAKIMVVDDYWAMIGSTNWDARSLRLNFELNLEIYDAHFARRLDQFLLDRIEKAEAVTGASVAAFSLPRILRNRAMWLMSPYL